MNPPSLIGELGSCSSLVPPPAKGLIAALHPPRQRGGEEGGQDSCRAVRLMDGCCWSPALLSLAYICNVPLRGANGYMWRCSAERGRSGHLRWTRVTSTFRKPWRSGWAPHHLWSCPCCWARKGGTVRISETCCPARLLRPLQSSTEIQS